MKFLETNFVDYTNKCDENNLFNESGIVLSYQQYGHPEYRQLYGDFIPYMSVIDLLFNEGENSLEIIRSGSSFE